MAAGAAAAVASGGYSIDEHNNSESPSVSDEAGSYRSLATQSYTVGGADHQGRMNIIVEGDDTAVIIDKEMT